MSTGSSLSSDSAASTSAGLAPHVSSVSSALASSNTVWFKREVHAYDEHLKAYLRGNFPSIKDVEDVVPKFYLRIWKGRLSHPILSSSGSWFLDAANQLLTFIPYDEPKGERDGVRNLGVDSFDFEAQIPPHS